MIIAMRTGATAEEVKRVVEEIAKQRLQSQTLEGQERTVIAVLGKIPDRGYLANHLIAFAGVESAYPIAEPYKLASKGAATQTVTIGEGERALKLGNGRVIIMAGPCSIESEGQLEIIAKEVKMAGASVLRGGAFKPRTAPRNFEGLGYEGLKLLKKMGDKFGLLTITEVMEIGDISLVADFTDILQVGARNAQNYNLLKALGKIRRPVLLKRGMSETFEELLSAAEYILDGGNPNVILCLRGIRTFEPATRNTSDIDGIAVLKEKTHLPIIFDPSHAAGYWQYVPSLSKAAIAAGADGLLIEVHHKPEEALSDGGQSLKPDKFAELMEELRLIARAVGREI